MQLFCPVIKLFPLSIEMMAVSVINEIIYQQEAYDYISVNNTASFHFRETYQSGLMLLVNLFHVSGSI